MAYKLIAIDMDDTLINSNKEITPRSMQALKDAEAAGAHVVLASGRMADSVRRLYEPLGLASPCICGGGSQLVDKDFNLVYKCYIEPDIAKQVLDYAKELGLYAQIFDDGANYYFREYSPHTDVYYEISKMNPVEAPERFDADIIDTPKVLIIDDPTKLLEVQKLFEERFPMLNIGRSRPHFLEMNNPAGNKGNTLKKLADELGVKQEEVIAIGDNQIDASMIEWAGLGVAIGNAIDEIKEIADYVSADNDHEGVTEVIEKFILGK